MLAVGVLASFCRHRAQPHRPESRAVRHSPARPRSRPPVRFARNDLAFDDPTGTDHDLLGVGLRRALYNYMLGLGLDHDVRSWLRRGAERRPGRAVPRGRARAPLLGYPPPPSPRISCARPSRRAAAERRPDAPGPSAASSSGIRGGSKAPKLSPWPLSRLFSWWPSGARWSRRRRPRSLHAPQARPLPGAASEPIEPAAQPMPSSTPPPPPPPPEVPAPPAARRYGDAGISELALGLGYSSDSGLLAAGGFRYFVWDGVAPGVEATYIGGRRVVLEGRPGAGGSSPGPRALAKPWRWS